MLGTGKMREIRLRVGALLLISWASPTLGKSSLQLTSSGSPAASCLLRGALPAMGCPACSRVPCPLRGVLPAHGCPARSGVSCPLTGALPTQECPACSRVPCLLRRSLPAQKTPTKRRQQIPAIGNHLACPNRKDRPEKHQFLRVSL